MTTDTSLKVIAGLVLLVDNAAFARQDPPAAHPRFVDQTDAVGLGPDIVPATIARLCFVDLNGDTYPDAVIDRHRVFLNQADAASPVGRRFVEVPADRTGLPAPQSATVAVFADLNNDGHADAIFAENIDSKNAQWKDHGLRTRWQPGRGDGTFGAAITIDTPPRTTICIAVGDVNVDGHLDLYLGNTYVEYGAGHEAYCNDLLLSVADADPPRWARFALPEDAETFSIERDLAGRPTFGAMIVNVDGSSASLPQLLELSYGRRWNRLWSRDKAGTWRDVAPTLGIDGDAIRHGRYPEWLKERGKTDPRFDREDEPPFRANGNTFDAAVGDVDNDGRFDLLITEITHEWAGESADRTRLLFQERGEGDAPGRFTQRDGYNLDRLPPPREDGKPNNWNQGDLFGDLADFNNDGLLDVVLSSGDYPDDERLRVFLQTPPPEPSLRDATKDFGIDHDGSQQISLGDVDGDGDMDILVGQTFNRLNAEQIHGRSPHLRVFINEAATDQHSLQLTLHGDGMKVNRDALGAIVRVRLASGVTLSRQLIGIGGHAGKQHAFSIHFGLGAADRVESLEVRWPDAANTTQKFEHVAAGRYQLIVGGTLAADQ